MQRTESDGATVREHLVKAASGIVPDQNAILLLDDHPELPSAATDVWAIFMDLHTRRGFDENGPMRFSWFDVYAYMGVTGAKLDPWKLQSIFALESAYFLWRAENKK